jgi:hypothetical protein
MACHRTGSWSSERRSSSEVHLRTLRRVFTQHRETGTLTRSRVNGDRLRRTRTSRQTTLVSAFSRRPVSHTLATFLVVSFIAVYALAIAVPAAQRVSNGFTAYYAAAHVCAFSPDDLARVYDNEWFGALIRRLGAPQVRDIFNVQPPALCLLLLPLAPLSMPAARVAWTALSLVLFLPASLALIARALGVSLRQMLWWAPLIVLYRPLIGNLRQGQVYLLLLLLVSVVFHSLVRKPHDRSPRRYTWSGGVALGLMAVTKTAGAWLWPLLALTRRWRLLVIATSVAGVVALAMITVAGIEPWLTYLKQVPTLWSNPARMVTAYQTVTSLIAHLTVFDPTRNPHPLVDAPLLGRLATFAVQLASLLFTVRWMRLDHPTPTVRSLSAALALSLMVTNAPVAEDYHYTLVLPSLVTAIWHAATAGASRTSWGVLLVAALMLGAPLPFLFPPLAVGWLALFAYPRVYGAFVLWLWLGHEVNRNKAMHG